MIMNDKRIHKLAISKSISDYYFRNNGYSLDVYNNGIMLDKYKTGPQEKKNLVFCHTRKGTETAIFFKKHFQSHALSHTFDLYWAEKKEFLSLNDTISYYQSSKYFVDFSALDGFALMPLEAMACGCIVFCLNNGGNQEYLENGVNGFCYEKCSEDLIPDILDRILQLEKIDVLYDRIRINALKTAQRFGWQEKIQPFLKFYRNLN
jgi:glycosyltransferase involved in cell wall biosynthesis